jgi:transglutaminase-like putative cysteine protease
MQGAMNVILDILGNINIISLLIACIFIIPILAGIVRPFTDDRIHRSFSSLFYNLILLASIILSIYLTRLILSDNTNVVLTFLYKIFPALRNAVIQKEIWVYALFITVLILITDGILDLLAIPIYRYAVVPMSNRFARAIRSMSSAAKRAIGGLWQLPTSVWLVLIFSILLNFGTEYYNSSVINEYANSSKPYQLIQDNVIQPLLNTSVVKNIQVLLNDSFKIAKNGISNAAAGKPLIQYFNGVTLDEAVKSETEIDAMAKKVIGSEANEKKKAKLIYIWISKNIIYDNEKAAIIAKDPTNVSSGAIVAYNTKKGVCFDYACLYVAMCRAVGLKVRFVTGLGYTGTAWGDHAWNQVYDSNKDIWINVDTTFGSSGIDYFDRLNFNLDHMDAVIQGEW